MKRVALALVVLSAAVPARAAGAAGAPQVGLLKRAQQFRELQISDDEEQKLGTAVSEKVRERYGVVQNVAVHKYVALVGTVLARASSRPSLPYQFIVLDTDGVNAFAAPGGFIHITRGALGLIQNEAELADVLAHEVIHVTEKHTVKAIQKGKMIQMGANETLSNNAELFSKVVDKATDLVLAGFGRAEELESDSKGLVLANKVGYAPGGLSEFLARLMERNKSSTQKQGLFASHPEMRERLDKIAKEIAAGKLTSTATLEARYRKFISYKPKPLTEVAVITPGAAGLTGGEPAKGGGGKEGEKPQEQPKPKGFGLGKLLKPGGEEKKSAEVTGSAASRGVDTERNARGGDNPKIVAVTLTPAEIEAFKKEGKLQ